MSEFFKALEQAERDRELAEARERLGRAPAVPKAETLNADGAALDQEVEPEAATTRTNETTPGGEPHAAAAPAAPPAPFPAPARPAESRRPTFFERPASPTPRPAHPAGGVAVPPAQNRTAPAVPERSVPPAQSRTAPAVPERSVPPAQSRTAPAVPERSVPPVAEHPVPTPPERAVASPVQRPGAGAAELPAPIQRVTPRPKKRSKRPLLIADLDPRSVAAEAYRTLRANLDPGSSERAYRTILITSPSMGEGKSTTAANLAVVAAQSGSRVCLVDADMRRPSLHDVFGVPNHGGFTRALSQSIPLSSVAVPTDIPNLSLVVSGSADGLRPAQLLNAPRLHKVLQDPGTEFDLVILDTPPVISVADAMNMAAHCDGVLLVVRAGAVTPGALQQAVRQINQVNGKILGVLLNQVDLRRADAEYYRHYRAYYSTAKRD